MSPARAASGALLLCALAAPPACAQNAVLELELELPQSPAAATTRYAVVRVVTGDVPFDEEWQGEPQLPPFALDPGAKTVQRVSLDGSSDVEAAKVRVKVRFCRDPNCAAIGDDVAPEVRLQLARAFYAGKRTSYAWSIPCVPNVAGQTDAPTCATAQRAELDVAKCDVAGCRSGVARSYCVGDKHFCEE